MLRSNVAELKGHRCGGLESSTACYCSISICRMGFRNAFEYQNIETISSSSFNAIVNYEQFRFPCLILLRLMEFVQQPICGLREWSAAVVIIRRKTPTWRS